MKLAIKNATRMQQEWITIYKANKKYQADLMKVHLDNAGIEAIVIDHSSLLYTGMPLIGENSAAELKVQKEDEQKALEILKEYNE